MKFLIVLLTLNTHVLGSIFGEFRDVMSSLENSFQKMVIDVVTDVRDTIDCTVEAVESALSLGSMANPVINPKCRGTVKEYQDKEGNRKDLSLSVLRDTSFSRSNKVGDLTRDISKQNEMLNQKKDNPQDMKYKLAIDDNRLSNIKTFLKDELEKMSATMKIQFKDLESDENSALDAVIKYINILHNVKHTSKSDSEINETQRILDGALKILNINVKNKDSDDDKVNKLLTILEHESSNDKINNVQSTLSKLADDNFSSDRHNTSHLSPGTFKDIFSKALGTTLTKSNKDERNQKIEEVKNSPLNGIDLSQHNVEDNVEPMDYESLFGGRHGKSNDEALDEATKILEDSKRTNSILSNLFSKAAQTGSSIFDNPEPF